MGITLACLYQYDTIDLWLVIGGMKVGEIISP